MQKIAVYLLLPLEGAKAVNLDICARGSKVNRCVSTFATGGRQSDEFTYLTERSIQLALFFPGDLNMEMW